MIERTSDIETRSPIPPYLGLIPGRDRRSQGSYGPRLPRIRSRMPGSQRSGGVHGQAVRAPPGRPRAPDREDQIARGDALTWVLGEDDVEEKGTEKTNCRQTKEIVVAGH